MSIGGLIYITIACACLFIMQWKTLNDPKSKAVFAVLMSIMWVLAIIVAYAPTLPGPYELVETVIGTWVSDSH